MICLLGGLSAESENTRQAVVWLPGSTWSISESSKMVSKSVGSTSNVSKGACVAILE